MKSTRPIGMTVAFACSCFVFLSTSLLSPDALHADDKKPKTAGRPGSNKPLWVAAMAKAFCINLRDFYSKKPLTGQHADTLRRLLDPEYLRKHHLDKGELPAVTTPFRRLDTWYIADDLQSVLCVVDNDKGQKEVFVFRIVTRGRRHYFRPGNPPDPQTGFFAPWVLRATISKQPARAALPVPGTDKN